MKTIAKSNPVFVAKEDVCDTAGKVLKLKQMNENIKATAKAIYDKVSPAFEKQYGITLTAGLAKILELNLKQKSPNELRKERRHHYTQIKTDIENQLRETAFERLVVVKRSYL